jgi:hypothetical protein
MGAIYRQARQVLGWLGEPTEDSEIGIEFLCFLGNVERNPSFDYKRNIWDIRFMPVSILFTYFHSYIKAQVLERGVTCGGGSVLYS